MTVVAIDGPAGAGKSTIARLVAERLGWRYVDTGALYRAITLAVLREGVDVEDRSAVEEAARRAVVDGDGTLVTLDGEDVSRAIRDPEVTTASPIVSGYPGVREALLERQRELIARDDVVMEGRDIGTVVAPDAGVKIFLTASLEERARRRARDLRLPSDEESIAATRKSLMVRDTADSERDLSPLVQAEDAVVIDTTDMTLGAVADRVVALVRGAGSHG